MIAFGCDDLVAGKRELETERLWFAVRGNQFGTSDEDHFEVFSRITRHHHGYGDRLDVCA